MGTVCSRSSPLAANATCLLQCAYGYSMYGCLSALFADSWMQAGTCPLLPTLPHYSLIAHAFFFLCLRAFSGGRAGACLFVWYSRPHSRRQLFGGYVPPSFCRSIDCSFFCPVLCPADLLVVPPAFLPLHSALRLLNGTGTVSNTHVQVYQNLTHDLIVQYSSSTTVFAGLLDFLVSFLAL
jgi:hypothetical protein